MGKAGDTELEMAPPLMPAKAKRAWGILAVIALISLSGFGLWAVSAVRSGLQDREQAAERSLHNVQTAIELNSSGNQIEPDKFPVFPRSAGVSDLITQLEGYIEDPEPLRNPYAEGNLVLLECGDDPTPGGFLWLRDFRRFENYENSRESRIELQDSGYVLILFGERPKGDYALDTNGDGLIDPVVDVRTPGYSDAKDWSSSPATPFDELLKSYGIIDLSET